MEKEVNLEATINVLPYIGASFVILLFSGLGLVSLPPMWALSPIGLALVIVFCKLIFSAFKKQ